MFFDALVEKRKFWH